MVSIEIQGLNSTEAEAIAQAALGANPSFSLSPWMMGAIIDAILLGVVSQQVITWWTWSVNERKIIKYMVYYCILHGLVYSGFLYHLTLFNFAINFGKWRTFLEVPLITPIPFFDSAIGMPIQIFYMHRAYRLHQNNIFVLIVASLAITTAFGAGCATLYYVGHLSSELQAGTINTPVVIWLGSMLATDVIITFLVGSGLYRSRTGWSSTDNLVRRLIMLTVETQLMPTLLTFGFLVEFSITPAGSLGIFFEMCQSKFYILGFLATLNSRYNLKREIQGIGASAGRNQTKTNTFALGTGRLQQATVNVTTDTYVESFQMPAERRGVNRDPAYELKEISEEDSVENLDYTHNVSKKNLHENSQV